MQNLNKETLKLLSNQRNGCLVSIYLPTHRQDPIAQEDAIRFKNLLAQSEDGLLRSGYRQTEVSKILSEAHAHQTDRTFWKYQSEGLAVFIGKDFFRFFKLPWRVPELALVSNQFYLKPILGVLQQTRPFYVLCLSLGESKVYRVSDNDSGLEDFSIPDWPAWAKYPDDPQQSLQYHTAASFGRPSTGQAIFHGHGGAENEDKEHIVQELKQVDRALAKAKLGNAPIVLCGVDRLLALFESVSGYPNLVDRKILGSPASFSESEVFAQSEDVIREFDSDRRRAVINELRGKLGRREAIVDVKDILHTSLQGGVESVAVDGLEACWGFIQDEQVVLHEERARGDQDILDVIAVRSFNRGANVLVARPGELPSGCVALASLREGFVP